jgi:hypothetical protein
METISSNAKRLLLVDNNKTNETGKTATNLPSTPTNSTTTLSTSIGTSSVALAASMTSSELAAIKKRQLIKNQARASLIANCGVKVPAFGSVVFPPSSYRKGMDTDDLEPPQADLNVEWVFGYGTFESFFVWRVCILFRQKSTTNTFTF